MDEEDDITAYLPGWQAAPIPFQSDEPVAPPMIHGVVEDVDIAATAADDGEPTPPSAEDLVGLPGPAPQTGPFPTTTIPPTTTTTPPPTSTTTTPFPTTTTTTPAP